MIGPHFAPTAISLLIVLIGSSFHHLASCNLNSIPGNVSDLHTDILPELSAWTDGQKGNEDRGIFKKDNEEEDLFKDVDPKTLAAVLLESLSNSKLAIRRGEEEQKENVKVESMEGDKGHDNQEVPMMARADRDRQLELELLLAAQGKEQDREKKGELEKAQEEEEKVTEKVTSHTTSQDIHVQMEQLPKGLEVREDNQQGMSPQEGPNGIEEEEEQLNPEELKSLETMMQVFPRLSTVAKREESSENNERDIRDYSSYNKIMPFNKGNNLAMTKNKLKWQEETQKALNFPTFETNLMDEFESKNYGASKSEQAQNSAKQELFADDEAQDNANEEDEDALSPEEEEARAKAEQEEMRRQAAEAQRAKLEEEKLADIASDMLLRYMGKQGNENKKQSSNAVEDKRSDEEQMEENDIDPQTIDKLIEISSKLHLPADDVVDIISDVEKKKKKDMLSGVVFHQQPKLLNPSFSVKHVLPATPISIEQNLSPVSKHYSPAFGKLKTWLRDKPLSKSPDLWGYLPKRLLANQNQPKPSKPLKQEFWIKSLKPRYPFYPYTYYQRNAYPVYPYYFPPPPRPKPHFYIPKSESGNNLDENSWDESYYFPQKHFYSWVRTPPRNPTFSFQQKPYFSRYPLPLYPWTFQSILRPRSPPRVPPMPPQQKKYYYSASARPTMANENYYVSVNQPGSRKIHMITQMLD